MGMAEYNQAQSDVNLYENRVSSYQIKVLEIQGDLKVYQEAIDKGDPQANLKTLEKIKSKLAKAEANLAEAQQDLAKAKETLKTALDDGPPAQPAPASGQETAEQVGQRVFGNPPAQGNQAPAAVSQQGQNSSQDDEKAQPVSTPAGSDNLPKQPVSSQVNDTKPKVQKPVVSGSNTGAGASPNKRQYNPLGDFSSYTYRITLFGITPESVNSYKDTGRWDNKNLFLILQSGGANNEGVRSDSSGNTSSLDAGRGSGFELDFYIDDLEILSYVNSKETGMPSNSLDFKFKVIEPYGMTFPTKLVQLQSIIQKKANAKREVKQQIEALQGHYLLSIRFYGYDENGQLVTSAMYGGNGKDTGSSVAYTDTSATFERNFPIIINKFNFRLEGKGSIYNIEAKQIPEQVAYGAKRGIVVNPISLTGSTVGEMLGGLQGNTKGLLDQINESMLTLKEKQGIEIPDEYEVVFENDVIKNSSLIDDKKVNKERVPMAEVKNTNEVNKIATQPIDITFKNNRTMKIEAGTTILQAIDQIVTQSQYVSKSLTFIDSEETQPVNTYETTDEKNPKPQTIQWYIVSPVVSVIGYDNLRNDYAYKITYVVKTYQIPYIQAGNIRSVPKYPGPHKIYNYYYTGKNSEVLSYEQNYNLLYFNVAAATSENSSLNPKSKTPIYQRSAMAADSTGKASGSFDSEGIVKTFLYSPADQLTAKIKILGDPDFLMPSTSGRVQDIMEKWYGKDFTVNPNSGQIFIEIKFQQVEDYTHENGLLIPNGNIDFWDFSNNPNAKQQIQGMVFMVAKVLSRFSRGVFIQEFTTIIPNFSELFANKTQGSQGSSKEQRQESPNKSASNNSGKGTTNTNNTQQPPNAGRAVDYATAPDQSDAETARLAGKPGSLRDSMLNTEMKIGSSTYRLAGAGQTPNDDTLTVTGPTYKRTYTQANFYNGDLERAHKHASDPANKSGRYFTKSDAGGGRGVVNP